MMLRRFLQNPSLPLQKLREMVARQRRIESTAIEHMAYTMLTPYLPKNHYPITNFMMLPSAVLTLMNDMIMNQRKTIVELGSGFSTLVLARFIVSHNLDVTYHSIDHDEEWYGILHRQLVAEGLTDIVTHHHAPLTASDYTYQPNLTWYDPAKLDALALQSVDLLIIDGPPAFSHTHNRYGAVNYFKERLTEGATIFVDDATRSGEQAMMTVWSDATGKPFKTYQRFATTDPRTIARLD